MARAPLRPVMEHSEITRTDVETPVPPTAPRQTPGSRADWQGHARTAGPPWVSTGTTAWQNPRSPHVVARSGFSLGHSGHRRCDTTVKGSCRAAQAVASWPFCIDTVPRCPAGTCPVGGWELRHGHRRPRGLPRHSHRRPPRSPERRGHRCPPRSPETQAPTEAS